ncbi:putative integral membrane protein [Theileria parva strain Muguga]|uniref:Uncharacterized protein n=1 Tax=Theileria parva TaxID=5875 RepID=Q4N8A9_THEPA|nr:putative integral membrane protein [Theileria parva strain Muguga]EAN33799.1 putative integral membrane protein [Theileria parva strain Muguga]|eukprot:XP_766082.1 hypothetical protein [Theileria parva strain Muguga]
MSGTCLTIGFIKMITIASVNDLFVSGNAVNKVLFLLVGNSLGAFLVHCITPFLDFSNKPLFMDTCGNGTHSLSPGKINAVRSQAIAILCYKLIIVLILTLLVSWAVLCYTNLHKEHRKWMKFNVTQANFVVKALNILLEQYPYVILLVLVELLHTIFKFLAVSYVMDGEPFNPIWLSLLLLMISDFFEVFGKFIPHLTNKVFNRQPVSTLIHTNNTPNTIHTVNIGNIGNTGNTTETTVTTENNDNTTENTDTGNRISSCGRVLRSLNGPLSMLFVLVAVEFMMIVMMFVEISFPHRPLSVNFLKFSSGVFITAFFSALRGCCVSVVYCRLCNVQVNRGLIEEVLEPKETKIVKSFLIGLFCIIEVVPGVVWYLAEPRVIPTLYIFIQRVRSQ